jgi:hypothetical protein
MLKISNDIIGSTNINFSLYLLPVPAFQLLALTPVVWQFSGIFEVTLNGKGR